MDLASRCEQNIVKLSPCLVTLSTFQAFENENFTPMDLAPCCEQNLAFVANRATNVFQCQEAVYAIRIHNRMS